MRARNTVTAPNQTRAEARARMMTTAAKAMPASGGDGGGSGDPPPKSTEDYEDRTRELLAEAPEAKSQAQRLTQAMEPFEAAGRRLAQEQAALCEMEAIAVRLAEVARREMAERRISSRRKSDPVCGRSIEFWLVGSHR